MFFVYIIRSQKYPDEIYVGKTTNLKKRLSDHNCGTTAHTEKYRPLELVVYSCFFDELKAIEFEKYLKSGPGENLEKKDYYDIC